MTKNNYSFTTYYIGPNGDISFTVITLDEDRRDRRMTKSEILKQIEELRKQVEALPDDEKKIRTIPKYKDHFFSIDYENLETDEIIYNTLFDEYTSSIGNYFKSKEDAEMVIRAMQIEQAIRIRRIELNDGWEPDFGDESETKYLISKVFYSITSGTTHLYDISPVYLYDISPVFGYYKSRKIAQQIIDEFEDDLLWYFTEYYPNKDKMYVWGD